MKHHIEIFLFKKKKITQFYLTQCVKIQTVIEKRENGSKENVKTKQSTAPKKPNKCISTVSSIVFMVPF